MDSFQLNKLIGAVLGTVFVAFSIGIVSDSIFASHAPENPGFIIEVAEGEGEGTAEEPAGPEPIGPLIADADVASGENVFKKCAACHTTENGGANKVGPNLWDIVNRPVASHEGFSYSAAMREFAQDGSVVWDYEHLSQFLLSPRKAVPGTAMGFAGLPKIDDRADIIAYLRTLSDNPAPLPEDDAAPDDAASADGDDEGAAAADENAAGGDASTDGDGASANGDAAGDGANEEEVPATQD